MTSRVLAFMAIGVLVCGLAWAVARVEPQAPAAGVAAVVPEKGHGAGVDTGEVKARGERDEKTAPREGREGPQIGLKRQLEASQKRVAGLQQELKDTTDANLKAACEALIAAENKVIEQLNGAIAASDKGDERAAQQCRMEINRLRNENELALRKYNLLKENQRLRDMAAKFPDDKDLQALVAKAITANLAIIELETQLAKLRADKDEAVKGLEKRGVLREGPKGGLEGRPERPSERGVEARPPR